MEAMDIFTIAIADHSIWVYWHYQNCAKDSHQKSNRARHWDIRDQFPLSIEYLQTLSHL